MYNIYSILVIILVSIVIMFGIKFIFLKYTKNGKEFIIKQKENTLEQSLKNIFTDIIEETKDINEESEKLLHKINNDIVNYDIIKNKSILTNNDMQFECIFNIDLPFEVEYISPSFLNFLNVNSLEELQDKYDKRVNKLDLNIYDIHKLRMKDIFEINKNKYEKLINAIGSNKNDRDVLENYKLEINTNIINTYINVISNISIKNNKLNISFKIFNIISKVNPILNEFINTPLYKELINNFIIDLPFPFIIVNSKGIKFLNKASCEWFELDYSIIDNLQNIENGFIPLTVIFDKIDKKLTYYIKEDLNNKSLESYCSDYILNGTKDKICKIPIKVIVLIKPFINSNNKKELFIIMNKDTFKDGRNNNNNIDEIINNKEESKSVSILEEKNSKLNIIIKELTEYNEAIKKLFFNTENLAFGRVNLKSKQVIVSNKLFEELVQYGSNKERYKKIISNIITSKDKLDKKFNFYSYDIMFTDKIIKILYTYYEDYTDILILENYMHKFISNNSLSALSNMYDISDLPIIIVNKKSEILSANSKFISLYNYNNNSNQSKVSLLDLVPDNDKNKVKRAISDAIKFNSNNLYDNITLLGKDKKYICKLLCIKTYGKIDTEEFITITIFPSFNE